MKTLPRSRMRPLSFDGETIVETSGHADNGPCNTRWWEIGVYQTIGGKFILSLEWNTNWQNEDGWQSAQAFDTADELAACLEEFDPLSRLVGFPTSRDGKYADRQKFIEKAIQSKWDMLVSTVMETICEAEHIA